MISCSLFSLSLLLLNECFHNTKQNLECVKATEMSIRVREMMYHKIKLNKIFSRITGKPESEVV